MIFSLNGHHHKYEPEKVCRLFFPFETFEFTDHGDPDDGIYTAVTEENGSFFASASVNADGKSVEKTIRIDSDAASSAAELGIAKCLYYCLSKLTGITPEWGMLTGIRPVKLYSRLVSEYGVIEAERLLKEEYSVGESKIRLTADCCASEKRIIETSKPLDFSLYVSIPFCPSRCSYCSFVSHSVTEARKLIPEYIKCLCEELKTVSKTVKSEGLHLRTVYIGGGTPTVLDPEELLTVMTAIKDNFNIASADEYTVEAGRPDTLNREKLKVIKKLGATRISVNPQTANDEVLRAVGRRHTFADMKNAFAMAREEGFDNINTDLIAGLPTDTVDSFKNSIDAMLELDPENITVHTLSMKRASNLTGAGKMYDGADGARAAEMLAYADEKLRGAGILPYYMYRQNKTVGNLENVGYSKPGYEGLYNVFIMDETHTIIACGASAVTKLKDPYGGRIERIFNYKYPYEYIGRFDVMLKRKNEISDFYKNL